MPTDAQVSAAAKAMLLHGLPNTLNARSLARAALLAAEAHDTRCIAVHRAAGKRIKTAKKAFIRRFGKSELPIVALRFREEDGRECVRLHRGAAWAEFTICNRRLACLRQST